MTKCLKSLGLVLVVVLALAPSAVWADGVGQGTGPDPTFTVNEGVVNTGFGTVAAGDVILCESGTVCNDTTPSTWSDVLVFYNSANSPFTPDATQDATLAFVFSDSDGSLATFLANTAGGTSLSSNHVVITENPTGPTTYCPTCINTYIVNSPENVVPEPGSLMLLGSGLLGMVGVFRRKLLAL